ncbi:Response regulator containing a CheY-like receiver domain and an HD-GYP domain [Hyella patelloides LEGE 07179]|uniref:Response regulator containing a CheY-like receiver domain and an HD-GYP domain n=1 Tax=Hyella patelloides LEGE 07179 TaxID=945734 RepID=A0A563VW70_9CYAN|nr:HD domain-containing phosphohydrolase [Hyella patelloides]VEP15503.1 Response regulator containing a CheY-like receiver domain and an HD-GYP domain [Hyella patelloides LEGE 07179]
MTEQLSNLFLPHNTHNSSSIVNNPELNPAKILVVDDRPLSRMTAVDLLSLDGYEVLEANGDLQILESIIEQKPDLLLLDIMLQETNGFELCKQIKQDNRTRDLPIILTAVEACREYRIKVAEVGADDLLTKPFDRFELSSRVKNLINQKRLNDGLDQTEQVLFSIAKAVENRASDRGGSCARVADLVRMFGEYLELSLEDIENLVFASHLHDIGTIAIPDSIMLKESELTAEERELIRQHVLIGEKICQPLRNRKGVLPIIRHHHERWDGTGYPDGLSATQIPYLAQIFQIIDIYDALASDRPHKKAYTPDEALKIIAEETAKGWRNPELIIAFTSFIHAINNSQLTQPAINNN